MAEVQVKYPNQIDNDTSLLDVRDRKETVLSILIDATTLIIPASTTGFPDIGYISIEDEIIKYDSKTPTQFNASTRGAQGTTAAIHEVDLPVYLNVIAVHHNILKTAIISIEGELGTNVKGVYTDLKERLEVIVRDFIVDEDVSSQIDGIKTDYVLAHPYYSGTLKVWLNGIKEGDIIEVNSTTFRVSLPLLEVGDELEVEYIRQP